jgi:hypothetical protein
MVIDRLGRIAAIHVGVPGKNDYWFGKLRAR